MVNQKLVEEKLKKYNQEGILKSISYLSEEERKQIISQINEIDFDEIMRLYESTKTQNKPTKSEIKPIDCIDKQKIKIEEKKELKKLGEQVIKSNQYAVVTMAGGQGTRLGFNKPKGAFKLKIGNSEKYIFQILAENLKKSKNLYDILPYWYIMTSIQNNEDTINLFEEQDYFGYDREKVKFFKQGELPLLTEQGEMVIENGKIKKAANGNGGVYNSMKKEKIIEDMRSKDIKWVYICGVDNIMVNPIDPIFIGLTIKHKMEVASKSVAKAYPEEKVGVFCKRDGKPSTVEYIELSEKMRIECDKNGELIYGDANIISHLLNVDAIEKIANQNLKYHLAIKNNLYKFETFIFDGFEFLDDMLVMRVKREEEFAPIKNKEGVDSPKTAIDIYSKYYF